MIEHYRQLAFWRERTITVRPSPTADTRTCHVSTVDQVEL